MEIDILIHEYLEGCPDAGWLRGVVEKVLLTQDIDARAEIGLVIVGQESMRQLNLSYLGEDEPTDVLAFSMFKEQPEENFVPFVVPPDGIRHLGEVIISYPQAAIQAEEHQHSVEREIAILIIHGVLHLLGYEHDKHELESQMRDREAEILSDIERVLE